MHIATESIEAVRTFYVAAMTSLKYRILGESDTLIRFGVTNDETFTDDGLLKVHSNLYQVPSDNNHVRFLIFDESILSKFLETGINNGGIDLTGKRVRLVRNNFLVATLEVSEKNTLEVIFEGV